MSIYESLAEQMLCSMDQHRHIPPEPVSGTIRGEMAVLRLLSMEKDGMHAGVIADTLHMTTSRIAAVLNALEKKGMIERTCDPQDKRRVLVLLTQTGMETCMRRRGEAKTHLTALLMRLTEEEAQTFIRLSSKLFGFQTTDLTDKEI